MGQCGCGDFCIPDYKIPAPGGRWYIFWRYAPCKSCDTCAGVMVALVDTDFEGLEQAADMADCEQFIVPLLHPRELAGALSRAYMESDPIHDRTVADDQDSGYYDTLEAWAEDHACEVLKEAVK